MCRGDEADLDTAQGQGKTKAVRPTAFERALAGNLPAAADAGVGLCLAQACWHSSNMCQDRALRAALLHWR